MIFSCERFGLSFELRENYFDVLVFEDPEDMYLAVSELYRQCNGVDGLFLLSEALPLSFARLADMALNPLLLEINSRKNLNGVYKEIVKLANSDKSEMTQTLNGLIVNYLEYLTGELPYPMDYEIDFDVSGLLKLYGVKLLEDSVSLAEKLVDYIKVTSRICGTKLFIFVNLHEYISVSDLEQVYKEAAYEKTWIMSVESRQFPITKGEKYHIIDADKCLIEFS